MCKINTMYQYESLHCAFILYINSNKPVIFIVLKIFIVFFPHIIENYQYPSHIYQCYS